MPAPPAVVPRPRAWSARSLTSVSAKKLSDGLLVSLISRSIGGDSTLASTSSPRRRPARHGLPPHRHATRLERGVQPGGGERRRVHLEGRAALVREPAVEGQGAQGPDPDGRPVAGVRAAAEGVEPRLVADHATGHALDPGQVERLREPLHRRAAAVGAPREAAAPEGGVAAAAQVEVAAPDALLVEAAAAQHLGAERALGAVPRERGRGGEQLRVRGQDPGGARLPAEHTASAGEVDHVGAGIAARGAHLACQSRSELGGGRGRGGGGASHGRDDARGQHQDGGLGVRRHEAGNTLAAIPERFACRSAILVRRWVR